MRSKIGKRTLSCSPKKPGQASDDAYFNTFTPEVALKAVMSVQYHSMVI